MSSPQKLTERAEAAHRALKNLRRRFQIGAWITVIVGGALLLLVAGYFYYGYSQIAVLKDPDLIVALVGNTVDDQIPAIRESLEDEVDKNATAWAKEASRQALEAIPPLREQLEVLASEQADNLINEFDVMGEKEFRRVLNENRSTMHDAIEQLKNKEDLSDDVMGMLESALQKELQVDMQGQAEVLLALVNNLNKSMKMLHEGKELSPEQEAERRVLVLARRLQIERFGDIRLDELSLPIVEDLSGRLEQERIEAEKKAASAAKEAAKPADDEANEPVDEDEDDEAEEDDNDDDSSPDDDEKDDEPETEDDS